MLGSSVITLERHVSLVQNLFLSRIVLGFVLLLGQILGAAETGGKVHPVMFLRRDVLLLADRVDPV